MREAAARVQPVAATVSWTGTPAVDVAAGVVAQLREGGVAVRGFYEQLALEELGQRITLPPKPEPLSAEEMDAARQNPGLARALYAIRIGLRNEGVREWNYSTNRHQTRANTRIPTQKCPCTIAARPALPRGNSPRCSINR